MSRVILLLLVAGSACAAPIPKPKVPKVPEFAVQRGGKYAYDFNMVFDRDGAYYAHRVGSDSDAHWYKGTWEIKKGDLIVTEGFFNLYPDSKWVVKYVWRDGKWQGPHGHLEPKEQ